MVLGIWGCLFVCFGFGFFLFFFFLFSFLLLLLLLGLFGFFFWGGVGGGGCYVFRGGRRRCDKVEDGRVQSILPHQSFESNAVCPYSGY